MIENIFDMTDLSDIPECESQLREENAKSSLSKMDALMEVLKIAKEQKIGLHIDHVFVGVSRVLKENHKSIKLGTLKNYLIDLKKKGILLHEKSDSGIIYELA